MRKHKLLTATAIQLSMGLFAMAGLSGQAFAATSINTAKTTPVKTSTVKSDGTADDLTIDTAGSITVTSGTALTVDSNNAVILNGKIDMLKSANGSTGILIDGGRTSNLTVNANITVTDDYTQIDSAPAGAPDGIIETPFSDNNTRYGIRSTGATPFIGNVAVTSNSNISVDGENSAGILFENKINGNFSMDGTINQVGSYSTGVSLNNGVTGNSYLSGNIIALGEGSGAVKLAGDFNGGVVIDGTYTSQGYATTGDVTSAQLANILVTPVDMKQSGPTVSISGNLNKGLLIGSTVTRDETDANKANLDQDGDGNIDSTQQSAVINSYSSSPALRVASADSDITLGGIVYGTTALNKPAVNYGLLVRGTLNANGIYQRINSTTLQLGGLGHNVTIDNGIGINGSVKSTALAGDATAVALMSGAKSPLMDVNGTISASTTSTTKVTDTAGVKTTEAVGNNTAYALDIAAGASLPTLNISQTGTISASATGSTNSVVAIRDQSNTLTAINNNHNISVSLSASDDNDDNALDKLTGRAIAIDTRTNTVGLTLTQTDTAPGDTTADLAISAPFISGDILLGSGNDTLNINGGNVIGNIELGAGNDVIHASASQIIGDVDFGNGNDSFSLTNKAAFYGKLTNGTSGTVALDVSAGDLNVLAGSALNISSLHVGSTSTLGLTLNLATPTTPILVSTGAVTFDNGATLSLTPDKLLVAPTKFTVITAPTIDLGALSTSSLEDHIPYLYHADIATNSNKTELYANFRLKNKEEAQFSDNQADALAAILSVAGQDQGATVSLVSQLTKTGFDQVYNQYFPDYSGENILTLSLGSASLNRTLGTLTLVPDNNEGQWWLQEYGYNTKRDYADTAGFESSAFSFAAGREREVYGNQMVGLYLLYTSATPLDTFAVAKENMVNTDATIGGYWRLRTGALKTWLHAGAGYTSFQSTRNILTTSVSHTAKADWNGFSYSGGGGISYEYKTGSFGFVPQIVADYYALSENKHSETGGGDYFDLTIAKRDSHMLSTTGMLSVNYNRYFIKPEIWVGYKQNISADIADTVTSFTLPTSTPFTLTGGNIEGGGPIAGFRLSADNQYSFFSLEGEYEHMDAYTNISFSLKTRFQF